MLQKHKETTAGSSAGSSSSRLSNILFADLCEKINRKGKGQTRALLLTSAAVYNLDENKFKSVLCFLS